MKNSVWSQVLLPAVGVLIVSAVLTFGGAWLFFEIVETLNRIP